VSGLWSFERGQMWTIDLAEADPPAVQARIPVEVFELTDGDPALFAGAAGSSGAGVLKRRFEQGGRCFGVRAQGRLAAYGWVSSGAEWIGELEREFRIPEDEIYIWDCETTPEFRRNRLYSSLLSAILGQSRAEGLRRVWIGSNLDNRPSMRGIEAAGFRPAAEITSLRLIVLRVLRVTSLPGSEPGLASRLLQALCAYGEIRLGGWLVGLGRGKRPGGS
jgi:ribosomal protein S18 acetylase RimI-like enzyme